MLTHKGTVTLETPRLILRRFTADDAQAMFDNWANDADVCRYLTWLPHGQVENTRALLERWAAGYEDAGNYQWAIELKALGRPVGSIGVGHFSERNLSCEVGYCMGKPWWGQGIMTEALRAVLAFLFEEVGMHRVEARHDPRNVGSGRVMEKAGMTLEGTLRDAMLRNDGSFHDLDVRAILRPEYEAARRSPTGDTVIEIIHQYDLIILKDGREGCVVEVYGDQDVFDVDIGSSPADWDNITVKRQDIEKVVH